MNEQIGMPNLKLEIQKFYTSHKMKYARMNQKIQRKAIPDGDCSQKIC